MRIALLIDLPPDAHYHDATVRALDDAANGLGIALDVRVTATDSKSIVDELKTADGIVIGPGSPYRDERAVWDVVRSARERGVPLVGT